MEVSCTTSQLARRYRAALRATHCQANTRGTGDGGKGGKGRSPRGVPNDCGAAATTSDVAAHQTRGGAQASTHTRAPLGQCMREGRAGSMHASPSLRPAMLARKRMARARAGRRRRSRRHMGGFGEEGDAAAPAVRDGGTGPASTSDAWRVE